MQSYLRKIFQDRENNLRSQLSQLRTSKLDKSDNEQRQTILKERLSELNWLKDKIRNTQPD